ncbi:MAG: methylmalonyl Co-A mutase-associated GTPase MeaB [Chitinophagales bacterium]|nr:methylmalonyl Co-A mutase-associated GTPase MeaB [Chitinophagales bacterium]MCZ2394273.1 methylmalonyl Co-A mutase-associated GTPase MeaB [Chitinophagales bacterium]
MNQLSKSKEAALSRLKRNTFSSEELWLKIRKRDKVALGQAISILESQSENHLSIAEELLQFATQHLNEKCLKIGITGVPGVGKSTFINAYTQLLVQKSLSVAILAVDPSSQQSGGSILGDKTRMKDIFYHPEVFIRPSPSGNQLGGVANKTREVILLCEAAGFDRILVETVGVGQSETIVHQMTDLFLLLMLPGAGDELQGIKRGIMELADILVVHKADGENAKKAKIAAIDYKRALHLFSPSENGWTPCVLIASSEPPIGIDKIHEKIESYFLHTNSNGSLSEKRKREWSQWFEESLEHQLLQFIRMDKSVFDFYEMMKSEVALRKISPHIAAKRIIESLYLNVKR